jgi:serine/threonine protein kinase
MGQVWLAEQTEPVRRRCALKLIKAGMYDTAVVQRFQSERQSLAIMEHPAIAKVLDAGATPDGQPYFAMEYVDGLPITEYCDQKKLEIRDRLKLFMQVCEGVQHAHQKAIIHRDLKPSNILVVEVDGKPTPRIIDFGLSKVTAPAVPGETLFTQAGAFLGTPGYMSPEQADPQVSDVDTRTDVYSLGVVLYELLTGYLPFDTAKWKKQRLDEVLRQLRETDPERPSARVSTNRDASAAPAAARGTEPGQLVSLLRGDLDWIALKALEKERERRYVTPSALAADVERYLQNRPVEARPASAGYRLRKYARRNRVGAAVAVGAFAVLMAFVVTQSVQLRRITRERDRADRITQFMMGMFKVSQPSQSRGNTITAREILDKASDDIDTGLSKDPELQAQMMDVMGNVYTSLGLYQKGGSLLGSAAETRRRILGPKNPETLRSTASLAWNLQRDGRYAEAEKLGRETLNSERKVLGPENRDTLKTEGDLAWTLYEEGKYAQAQELFRHTLEIQRRVLGLEDKETILSMSVLGWNLAEEGRYAEAEKMEHEAVDTGQRALGPLDPVTLTAMNNLAGVLQWQGKYADADKMYREMIELNRRGRGSEHPDTLIAMNNLANVLGYEGRYKEAADMQQETLEIQRRTLGPEHRDTLITAIGLASSLGALGKYEEAEKLLYQTRDIQRRVLGPESPRTATTNYNLACLAVRRGRRDDAFSFLREAVAHGLSPAEGLGMESDPDLKSLHDDPRFTALAVEARQRAGAAQTLK